MPAKPEAKGAFGLESICVLPGIRPSPRFAPLSGIIRPYFGSISRAPAIRSPLLTLQPHFAGYVTLSGSDSQIPASQVAGEASRAGRRDASAQTTGLSMTAELKELHRTVPQIAITWPARPS